jgi:hypothetical protein
MGWVFIPSPTRFRRLLGNRFAPRRAQDFGSTLPANLTSGFSDRALLLCRQFLCASPTPKSTESNRGWILSRHAVQLIMTLRIS